MGTALITVNYNQNDITSEFLEALKQCRHIEKVLVVIIDVSDQEQKTAIPSILPHQITVKEKNGGYSYGVNAGIREALKHEATQFCVLNNDTAMQPDFIDAIQNTFKKYNAFGGKIYYAKGYEYHKTKYTEQQLGNVLWYAGGHVDWKHAITTHRGVDDVDSKQYNDAEKTDFITGCLFCFDKKVFDQTGWWDEKYFLYYEDADYSERIKRAGYFLYYVPTIKLWHKNAQSTGGSGSLIHQKYQRNSQLRFAIKFAPLRTKLHVIKNYLFRK